MKLVELFREFHEELHRTSIPDSRLRVVLNELVDTVEYLLNSASFSEGELLGFDADEVARRLSVVMDVVQTE